VKFWLMKTEPDVFGWQDLVTNPEQRAQWDGVRNYQARNFMRDDFRLGDAVFFYHSSCAEPGIAGLAKVVQEAYADPSALDSASKYFDEKSLKDGASRWVMIDVQAVAPAEPFLALKVIRAQKSLHGLLLLQAGQRLSVQPVESSDAQKLLQLMGCKKNLW
jgi:predicted RNA-binding protein with PUA-like domain